MEPERRLGQEQMLTLGTDAGAVREPPVPRH